MEPPANLPKQDGVSPTSNETVNRTIINIPSIDGRRGNIGSWSRMIYVPISSNHSCLFAALDLLLFQKRLGVTALRCLAAEAIEADPDTFNDVTLEQPREAYIKWIQCSDSWAGYIELVALSRAMEVQIIVVDIPTGRHDIYGTDSMNRRIFLLYHGVHYDAVVGEPKTDPSNAEATDTTSLDVLINPNPQQDCITIFDPADIAALEQVVALGTALRTRRKTSSHSGRGHG